MYLARMAEIDRLSDVEVRAALQMLAGSRSAGTELDDVLSRIAAARK